MKVPPAPRSVQQKGIYFQHHWFGAAKFTMSETAPHIGATAAYLVLLISFHAPGRCLFILKHQHERQSPSVPLLVLAAFREEFSTEFRCHENSKNLFIRHLCYTDIRFVREWWISVEICSNIWSCEFIRKTYHYDMSGHGSCSTNDICSTNQDQNSFGFFFLLNIIGW